MGNRCESGTVTSAVMLMRKQIAIETLCFEKAFPKLKLSQKTMYDGVLSFWAEEATCQSIRRWMDELDLPETLYCHRGYFLCPKANYDKVDMAERE